MKTANVTNVSQYKQLPKSEREVLDFGIGYQDCMNWVENDLKIIGKRITQFNSNCVMELRIF